ncbi:2Fe-2S ferredoxin [Sporosarcina sp. P13]|uniref:Rieske (2Fe-2S) protein n=1 Tax=Sporosarcina sp. P13 TaxID=2048263 RepID=UPI000C167149|nr:Rieske (2Fe-2S) protein [Sporosarcina sp. P13]PIC63493.1 2Fe-2S ferredoxin [Sporosarcina sp. P13]
MITKPKNEIVVCKAEELPSGKRKIVTIKNMTIVVVNVEGKLRAFNNMCPHQGAPLEFGSISGIMEASDPQQYKYGCHDNYVKCPLHGWAFDIETGKSLFSEKVKIKTFEVREEGGYILLSAKGKQEDAVISDVNHVCG